MNQNQQHKGHMNSQDDNGLNPYAVIITREARLRGIEVKILDDIAGYFSLSYADQSIVCRESLSELTSAIAMSRCDDKAVTTRLLGANGLSVPAQVTAASDEENRSFLEKHHRIVVKPAHGEQGAGVNVDIDNVNDMNTAIDDAKLISRTVLLEQYVVGEDLRVIIIDGKVIAAAVRRPPEITGDGRQNIEELIKLQSQKREQATGGESHIPLDSETRHCIRESGYTMSSILPAGEKLIVHKTYNVHTGATIEDVTDQIHPRVREASVRAAQLINIPVVGLDFIVPSIDSDKYVFIEANERPGLANHEPQPTAERFIDFLFPQTSAN